MQDREESVEVAPVQHAGAAFFRMEDYFSGFLAL
jgi:hypothetical protein